MTPLQLTQLSLREGQVGRYLPTYIDPGNIYQQKSRTRTRIELGPSYFNSSVPCQRSKCFVSRSKKFKRDRELN